MSVLKDNLILDDSILDETLKKYGLIGKKRQRFVVKLDKSMTWSGHKLQGRIEFQGLKISIENRKGSIREGVDPNGHKWRTTFKYPYGYIREFGAGEDGDHIDAYIGPDKESRQVFIVRQQDPNKHVYDEDKIMLGFNSPEEAKKAYLKQYDNPDFFGSMDEVNMDKFKKMLEGNYEEGGGRLKLKIKKSRSSIYYISKACGTGKKKFDNPEKLERAKAAVRKQYPGKSEDSESFWKLVQTIYQNMI